MSSKEVLSRIENPVDLKDLTAEERKILCDELRRKILDTVTKNGGHLASNLGVIEQTVALETVFNGENDRILWDVGHQCYAHKLLTGRYKEFSTLRQLDGVSGFLSPKESGYDSFYSGHAGVAISEALGLVSALEAKGIRNASVVAVVGDGSLGSGVSLEALNNIRAHHASGFILVINDNHMSIARSVGTLSKHLNQMITGRGYNRTKAFMKMLLRHFRFGDGIIDIVRRMESAIKSLVVPGAFFEELGFKYVGPIDGHNTEELIEKFQRIRDIRNMPVCVHVITEKGRGYAFAERNPEEFHSTAPFDLNTGKSLKAKISKSYSQVFGEALTELADKHADITAVTAAMGFGTGLKSFSEKYPDRFFDVGIAEEHAVVFAGGLAAGGLKPYVAIYATFLQRALDQIFHDVCLQNLPVVFCVDRAGAVDDGPTHHGIYDLGFLRTMPNLAILLPRSAEMLQMMLKASYDIKTPVMIRYPRGSAGAPCMEKTLEWGKSVLLQSGKDLVIWAAGCECETALKTAQILSEKGISCAVRDARFLKPFDLQALKEDIEQKTCVVTLEDGIPSSGLGAEVDAHRKNGTVLHFGWPDDIFVPFGNTAELRKKYGLTPEAIAEKIAIFLKGSK